MRIGIIGSGSADPKLPPQLIDLAVSNPGVSVELIQPRLSLFAFTAYERLLVDVGYVDAMQAAAVSGCDAVMINSFADYGIEAARAALDIPVIGAGEAALQLAQEHGGNFCILTVWPESMRFLYDERLQRLGLSNRCSAIRHVSSQEELEKLSKESGVMSRMARHDETIIAVLRAARDQLIEQHAPTAIVLGCTCMTPIGAALAEGSAVPIIESSQVGLQQAIRSSVKSMVSGAAVKSRRTELIPGLVSAWLGDTAASAPEMTADCPVCITHVE